MQDIPHTIRIKVITNVVLGVLLLSLGALSLAPIEESVSAQTEGQTIYRCAEKEPQGVSLMFNVYWGHHGMKSLCINLAVVERHIRIDGSSYLHADETTVTRKV